MKVLIKRIIIILICTILPVYMYMKTPSLESQKMELSKTNVMIVNEDEGIDIYGIQYNFGNTFVNSFVEESEFNVSSENFADAYNALENGNIMYMIVIDREFSKAANSFDSLNQINAKVTYYYNHTYDRSLEGSIQSEAERNRVFDYLQDELSTIYLKTIVDKVEQTKSMLRDDIENDIEMTEDIAETTTENTTKLKEVIAVANKHISEFKNEMAEKIGVVSENVRTSTENEEIVVNSATSNEQHTNDSSSYYSSFSDGVESNYNLGHEQYEAYTNIVVGEDGISNYISSEVIPIYSLYDQTYKSNLNIFNTLALFDETTATCGDTEALKSELKSIQISRFDIATQIEAKEDLFTDAELDTVVNNVCTLPAYNYTVDSGALNTIYVNSKVALLNEITEDASAQTINVNSYLNSSAFTDSGSVLTAADVNDFNAYNKFMAILKETETVYSIPTDATYYMSSTNLSNFRNLMTIIKSNYNLYGGAFSSMSSIVNSTSLGSLNDVYGLYTLNTEDDTIFGGLKSEVTDLVDETGLLDLYNNSLVMDKLEEEVIAHLTAKFFTLNSMTMEDYGNSVDTKIDSYVTASDALIADYNLSHDNNLSKLSEDSKIIIANYEKSNQLNTVIIETGTLNLNNYDIINDNITLVNEENKNINNHFSEIRDNNTNINETITENEEDFLDSIKALEEANEEQEEFVSDYEEVLSVASINGVSNSEFYNFVTNPIIFTQEDVGENVTTLGTYFIILWLFLGLFIINALRDRFSSYFTLNFNKNNFKENKLLAFINKNLVYLLVVLIFSIIFTLSLVSKYMVMNKVLFIIEFTVILLLINYIMRFIFNKFKFKGYVFVLLCILVIFTIMFTANDSLLFRIISIPFITIENFLMVHIYEIAYGNAYLYTLGIYGSIALIVAVISFISYLRAKRKVGI